MLNPPFKSFADQLIYIFYILTIDELAMFLKRVYQETLNRTEEAHIYSFDL